MQCSVVHAECLTSGEWVNCAAVLSSIAPKMAAQPAIVSRQRGAHLEFEAHRVAGAGKDVRCLLQIVGVSHDVSPP